MCIIKITCQECGNQFIFTDKEIKFYIAKGFQPPRRCKQCRESINNKDCSAKRLGLKQSSFLDNVQIYGMPIDIRQEHS